MAKLSHRLTSLSILSAAIAIALAPTAALSAGPQLYSGRWTVSDDKPVYSSRGILYKTVDVAPCGRDYCGVSVGDNGACGPVLFRFTSKSISSGDRLQGHGRWGNGRKNIVIEAAADDNSAPGGRYLSIDLGDGYDFGERSGNMPKFRAGYHSAGAAHCVAR
jgi:hypothetical protein